MASPRPGSPSSTLVAVEAQTYDNILLVPTSLLPALLDILSQCSHVSRSYAGTGELPTGAVWDPANTAGNSKYYFKDLRYAGWRVNAFPQEVIASLRTVNLLTNDS